MNTKKMSIEPACKIRQRGVCREWPQKSQNKFFEPIEGRLSDLITQGPHALVVSHRSALFVLFVPFVAIRVHSWFAFMDDRLFFLE